MMRVMKWDDRLAVRLPASLVKALDLREGDEIEFVVERSRGFAVRGKSSVDDLLNRLRRFRGRLPADFRLSRDGS